MADENPLVQQKGVRTRLITTGGFRELLEVGRQRRPSLYGLQADEPQVLVNRRRRCDVPERVHYHGVLETALDVGAVRNAARRPKVDGVRSIAICFRYSFVDSRHEQTACEIVVNECPGAFVSASHDVAAEYWEFERLSTTVLNTYIDPVPVHYFEHLGQRIAELAMRSPLHITQSNGGTQAASRLTVFGG